MVMAKASFNKQPTFFWQGLLIVLPVVVLAEVGLWSLRQDKILAQHEAAERAQGIADDLLPKVWAAATGPSPVLRDAFEVDQKGELIFPPPYRAVPTPRPLDASELNIEQARLWLVCQRAEGGDPGAAIRAYQEFVAADPPGNFGALAHYALGLLLAKGGKKEAAAEAFNFVVEKYPEAAGESGLRLQPLAELKLIELGRETTNRDLVSRAASLQRFCSNAVYHPTPLTPYLLELAAEQGTNVEAGKNPSGSAQLLTEAAMAAPWDVIARLEGAVKAGAGNSVRDWRRLWTDHQSARRLFAAARPSVRPVPCAFEVEDQDWLAFPVTPSSNPTSRWFVCRPEREICAAVAEVIHRTRQVPGYFGVGVEVGGRRLGCLEEDLRVWYYVLQGGKGASETKAHYAPVGTNSEPAAAILASASGPEAGSDFLKVKVYLTSPRTLFQLQRIRRFWFGSLITASAAAALIGLLTSWRAFYRQRQLSEMKSNFVSSVSHELRAPIASVRLLAESLERGTVQEAQKQGEYFRFIVQECRRLSSLIENVLDFSRIEEGRKRYEFEPTDVVALVRQTVKLMETYAQEKQVALELDLGEMPPEGGGLELRIDGRAVQQALVNLVDNAIKHSPKGGTVIVGIEVGGIQFSVFSFQYPADALRGRQEAAAGRKAIPPDGTPGSPAGETPAAAVRLWVEDHGEGIPAEEQEKIFERFYRRGSELRRETQGVGIGLSIVKHIVEAHGGRVRVRSAVGEGSRFTIELRLKNDE